MLTIIPHRPQHFSWDCGLVSVSMVLAGMGVPRSQPHDIYALYPVQSIWTIDLAYILRHFDVHDFTMYTSYIGVNWQNVSKHFYTDTSSDDIRRVHSLFAKARDAHVRVVPLVLSIDDIRRFLVSNRYAIIMLVNVNLLSCSLCKKGYDMIYEPEFVGHYVVLIGYDPATDMFSYRDPGTEAPLCQVSSTVLEAARMSSGTDHDLIVIKVM
ncbi:Guanylyl cyclase [Entophlyctis helioformis]|nr:Guanylyl cyclase [Entophlyctis helioformis]